MVLVDVIKGCLYLLDVIMQVTTTISATTLLFSSVASSLPFTDFYH